MANDFLGDINKAIEQNLSDENFGVSELAGEMNMSRSNLLRKVKSLTGVSASQHIRNVRLAKGMGLIREGSLTVSEIAYKVGFGSPSYFIKCFREYYGYPPGEVSKNDGVEPGQDIGTVPQQSHQLAAIMFTDIEGYTALMQQDENKAIAIRNRHREAFHSMTRKYKGKILQYYGDGTLSTFSSAIDAVKCGIELQLSFREPPAIPVRIGIHTGDIIFNKEGIIGDGVNVASRIESLAASGSVFISEKVFDEIKNQSGIETESMGIFELKNVNKPQEVFAISNTGLIVPDRSEIQGKTSVPKNRADSEGSPSGRRTWIRLTLAAMAILAVLYVFFIADLDLKPPSINTTIEQPLTKSIVVLPFINDSNDSSNVYIINGLMESILNNLQKIEDLRVVSRTSAEKYRNSTKTSPEIAQELNVSYLISGSGQKIGDRVMLNIQLIDGINDKHLWSEQYAKDASDIFSLQMEVAKSIAGEIEVYVSPKEEEQINKLPTEDPIAYDYFLQGLDLMNKGKREHYLAAIDLYKEAIKHDPKFARAYAATAMAYYFRDENQANKEHTEDINFYADQAVLIDPELPQSLIAKALYYVQISDFEESIPYFEKALSLHPNYDLAIALLIDLYANKVPNTEKYLEYALKGNQLDISSYDSTIASISYLHLSNALIQSGFVAEADRYVTRSLEYLPDFQYARDLKAFIDYARNPDLEKLRDDVLKVYAIDTTRIEFIQEAGKVYYYLGDYRKAYRYYDRVNQIRDQYNLVAYRSENGKIGVVLDRVGRKDGSEEYLERFRTDAEGGSSIYKHYELAAYYSYTGDRELALSHFKEFSETENYHYWIILFTELDPLFDNIKEDSAFISIMKTIEDKFWKNHAVVRKSLEGKGLL